MQALRKSVSHFTRHSGTSLFSVQVMVSPLPILAHTPSLKSYDWPCSQMMRHRRSSNVMPSTSMLSWAKPPLELCSDNQYCLQPTRFSLHPTLPLPSFQL